MRPVNSSLCPSALVALVLDLLRERPLLPTSFVQAAPLIPKMPEKYSFAYHHLHWTHKLITEAFDDKIPIDFSSFTAAWEQYSKHPPIMLQNKLTAALENRLFKNLKETGNDRSRARIISCSGRNAGAWITALPSPIYNRVLTDEEFRVASRLRCGVTPVTNLPDTCSCGSSFTSNPTHSLACQRTAHVSITSRHDTLVQAIAAWCRRGGAAVEIEPQNLSTGQKRPDLLVYMGTHRFIIDAVIGHPLAPSYIRKALEPLGLASFHEKRKMNHWRELAVSMGATMVPFSCETYGSIGDSATSFIQSLATHADTYTPWKYDSFIKEFTASIGVAIQQGNARVISRSLQKIHSYANRHIFQPDRSSILLPHISRQIRSPSHLSNSILSSPPIRCISQRNIIRRDNKLSSPHLPASQQNSRTTLAVNVVS